MSYDYDKLRGKIRERFRTQQAFSKALGMSECTLSKKLNNREDWSKTEMERACELLDIPLDEVYYYFFCAKCLESPIFDSRVGRF